MRLVIQLAVTISFLTISPLIAQQPQTFEGTTVRFQALGLIYTGEITLSGEPVQVAAFRDWPLGARVAVAGVAGAALGGLVGGLVGTNLDCQKQVDEQGAFCYKREGPCCFAPRMRVNAENDPCVENNCALIGTAIGAGAGFVIGAIVGAVVWRPHHVGHVRGQTRRQGRVSATVVPQRDGRFGVGMSVRF